MNPLARTISGIDTRLTRALQHLPASLKPYLQTVSFIGQPVIVTLTAVVITVVSFISGHIQIGTAAASGLISLSLSVALKHVWHRTRPDTAHALGLKTYSFPSGHSYGTVVIFGFTAFLAYSYVPQTLGFGIGTFFALLTASVGISRVYLGAHYPTDVLGGWALGTLVLLIIIRMSGL